MSTTLVISVDELRATDTIVWSGGKKDRVGVTTSITSSGCAGSVMKNMPTLMNIGVGSLKSRPGTSAGRSLTGGTTSP
jgi:hypothetical protein